MGKTLAGAQQRRQIESAREGRAPADRATKSGAVTGRVTVEGPGIIQDYPPASAPVELPDTELTRHEGCIHHSLMRLDAMLAELAKRLEHVSEPALVDAEFTEVSGADGITDPPRSMLGRMMRDRVAHIDRMASNVSGIIQRLRA